MFPNQKIAQSLIKLKSTNMDNIRRLGKIICLLRDVENLINLYMLYSYTISENFLIELSNLDIIDQHKVCSFIRSNFIDKENLYLKMDRKVLTKVW